MALVAYYPIFFEVNMRDFFTLTWPRFSVGSLSDESPGTSQKSKLVRQKSSQTNHGVVLSYNQYRNLVQLFYSACDETLAICGMEKFPYKVLASSVILHPALDPNYFDGESLSA